MSEDTDYTIEPEILDELFKITQDEIDKLFEFSDDRTHNGIEPPPPAPG